MCVCMFLKQSYFYLCEELHSYNCRVQGVGLSLTADLVLLCRAETEPHPSGRAPCCLDQRHVRGPSVALQASRAGLTWPHSSVALSHLLKAEIRGFARGAGVALHVGGQDSSQA